MVTTTCSKCGKIYEVGSEIQASDPDRLCDKCVEEHMKILKNEKIRINSNLTQEIKK
jgi:hypothetical protein